MNAPLARILPPIAPWCVFIPLIVPQLACSNSMRFDVSPHFDIEFDLEDAAKELYTYEEMLFIQWCSETLEADATAQKIFSAPNVSRSAQVCFTYPAKRFPEKMPDGVWAIELTNRFAADARFLREPIGKESRAAGERSVKHVEVFARQRSDKAVRLIGEMSGLHETFRAKRGRIEYQVFSIGIVGAYDLQGKRWSLVSKSIGPAGHR